MPSPDGRLITYMQDGQRHFRALAGSADKVVPWPDSLGAIIQWAADGRHFYAVGGDSTLCYYRIDIETRKRTLWKEVSIPDLAGLSVFGPLISANGDAYAYTWFRRLDDLYLVEGLK